MPLEPLDRNGRRIQVGDRVRIIGVPDLSGMSPEGQEDSRPIFEYLVGKYKRIQAFDEYGEAEFSFRHTDADGIKTWHVVWIEPYLLHLPQSRSKFLQLEKTSFIGSGVGPADFAENYKQYLDFGPKHR